MEKSTIFGISNIYANFAYQLNNHTVNKSITQ